jgi:heme-degrading monooxygenase HmoA
VADNAKGSGAVLELAILNLREGSSAQFEAAFGRAQRIISSMPGYERHEVRRCVERENRYLLLVWWTTLESHTIGFRQSAQYQDWKALLHHFYEPFPEVEHYSAIDGLSAAASDREKA